MIYTIVFVMTFYVSVMIFLRYITYCKIFDRFMGRGYFMNDYVMHPVLLFQTYHWFVYFEIIKPLF